ncbi:divergent polysaccharide deacetylase family protein [Bacillus songklensis]|uniref:Divergent polysaccharide deacetylase family protein n=1 Tax=Bacillus songklensis TaxID=1069116 RepID=A0ABV8B7U0_9BACI
MIIFTTSVYGEKPSQTSIPQKELAIVIDDFGNNMQGTDEMLKLPATLTIAIMPFLETTVEDAKRAHQYGHEVIVHLPMEPMKGKKSWLGPGAITTDLSNQEIRKRVEAAIDAIPHAVGMNHHMGSKATADERVMRIVLEVCKERGLFYLDSKTTGKSVIPKLAKELNIPYLENELFFDDIYTTQHIVKQANILARKLKDDQQMIAIGHVGITGPKVVNVLRQYIPVYEHEAKIVPLSELIPEYKVINKSMP